MENSSGKERLHERDRNFVVVPFRGVTRHIPSLEANFKKGKTGYWVEKEEYD
jgi:hypothetical protein